MSKKEEISGIEIHSEEVQDIMGNIPGRLMHYGATIIFSIFFILLVGSYFFTYNDVVPAPMVITTYHPPASLICKSSGRIEHWFVSDGELVDSGKPVAVISNNASFEDVFRLERIVDSIDLVSIVQLFEQGLFSQNLNLGDLQPVYSQLLKSMEDHSSYQKRHFLEQKIEFLKKEKVKQENYYKLLMEQKKIQETELELAEKKYKRHESMMEKGGISQTELETAEAAFLQSRKAYLSFQGSLRSNETNLLSQERAILELTEQDFTNIEQQKEGIEDNVTTLKNALEDWKNKFLISSPIRGSVTLTKFWSENHVISAGERLATVVPVDETKIVCRANVASTSIGKVEEGQKVNLKLSGFPFMQYGMLSGVVSSISLVPEENGYVVEIRLDEGMKSNYSEQLRLIQEMEGIAEIITQKTRLIYRFINPLKAAVKSGN